MKIVYKQQKKRFGQRYVDEMEKIRKEIAIMKKCCHPNIVRLHEIIDDPNHHKVFMGKSTTSSVQ
jgi:hypothetical protein